jgi:hypothetical protein
VNSSERLARRFFELVHDRERDAIEALLHPQITFSAHTIVRDFAGREDVMRGFYDTVFAWTLYDAFASHFEQLDDDTVRVTGRLRWMNNGELHDIASSWTLTFQDGQLRRFTFSTLNDRKTRAQPAPT